MPGESDRGREFAKLLERKRKWKDKGFPAHGSEHFEGNQPVAPCKKIYLKRWLGGWRGIFFLFSRKSPGRSERTKTREKVGVGGLLARSGCGGGGVCEKERRGTV